MTTIPESLANKVRLESKKTIELIDKKGDIRLILAHFEEITSAFVTLAEIQDDPETRFGSFVIAAMQSVLRSHYSKEKEEWYTLNKENIENILPPFRKFIESIQESILSSNFNGTIAASKTFFYAAWKHMKYVTS